MEKGTFETLCDEMGIEIIKIKRRNNFICIFTVYIYKVKFKYNNKIYNISAWVGIDHPKIDNIYYSIFDYLDQPTKFYKFLEKYK